MDIITYTQQFRHDLEVAYGVADEIIDDSRKDVTADSIMVKREKAEVIGD